MQAGRLERLKQGREHPRIQSLAASHPPTLRAPPQGDPGEVPAAAEGAARGAPVGKSTQDHTAAASGQQRRYPGSLPALYSLQWQALLAEQQPVAPRSSAPPQERKAALAADHEAVSTDLQRLQQEQELLQQARNLFFPRRSLQPGQGASAASVPAAPGGGAVAGGGGSAAGSRCLQGTRGRAGMLRSLGGAEGRDWWRAPAGECCAGERAASAG